MTTPSARPLLLTVLGDAVLPSGGRVWLGALTRAMEGVGVSAQSTRQALRRLAAQGLVDAERHGRLTAYRLSGSGRGRLEEAAERIYLRRELRWDGRWRLLTYTFPEEHRAARDALRRELAWLGYGSLSSGLWISPWDHGTRLDAVLAKHGVEGSVETFTSELEGDDRELAARAYDLAGLRREHRAFIDDVEPRIAELAGRELDDAEAFAERVLLVHRWRKFLFLDPGLPPQLLPTDWLGDRAGTAFLDLYRLVEAGGWRHWERMCAQADPEGRAPARRRSNLEPVTEGHRGEAHAGTATDHRRGGARGEERRTEEFLERLHAGQRIEATEWMPATYRAMNLKFIEMHANSEIMGALPEREWIPRAPSLRRKRSLAAKVQDEVGHAHLIYRVAESLGKPREEMFEDLIHGRTSFHNVFHYPTHSWGDVACIGFLVDGAAIVTQQALLKTSYAPYARVMRRVVAEESLHYRHGEDVMLALASGTEEQFEMLQEAVTRWWEPIMHFFGTNVPREQDPMIHWGVKTQTNEESRQSWLSQYVPKLWDMGLELPDPELTWDGEEGVWRYGEPDWDKLKAIVKGEPTEATARRLEMRRTMQRNHDWIRRIVTGDGVPAAAV
jgi:ring-1,2-phenylacetyl-CoA epoxidase subunit PaaA